MFEKIEDVPEAIAEFYTEEIRNEPTGEMVREEYEYIDEDGEKQTGTRLVPEMVDNVYVVKHVVSQSVSWDKVAQIIDLHKGTKDAVVGAFIDLAIMTDSWAFHDEYLEWYMAKPDAPERARDDEGQFIPDDPDTPENEAWVGGKTHAELLEAWQNIEPIRIFSDANKKYAVARNAKYRRDVGRYAPITVDGLTYDADETAYANIQGSVNNWDTLVNDETLLAKGLVRDGTMLWTLADDSHTFVTKDQLEAVLSSLTLRAALLHVEYTESKEHL